MTVYGQPQPKPEKEKKTPLWATILSAVLIGACLIGCVVGLMSIGDDQDPAAANRSTTAAAMCRMFIKDRLKAPDSAKFPQPSTVKTGAVYTVTGAVDAQNGFGAMIRSHYVCKVEDEGETWKLVSLNLD